MELGNNHLPYPRETQSISDSETVRQNERALHRERRQRWRHYGQRVIGAIALGSAVAVGHLAGNIEQGKQMVADSHPSIHLVYEGENTEYRDVATIVATGVGTRNPTSTAEVLTSHRQVGDVFALEYSNKDLNIDELTEQVVTLAHKNHVKTLVFDGYSMGGPIELAIAANIYKNEPDIQISDIILNSSPIGEGGITEKSQEAIDNLSRFLRVYPDLVYSSDMRFLVEMMAREDSYAAIHKLHFDAREFLHQAKSVYHDKITNPDAASGVLVAAQALFQERYGVEDSIKTLSSPVDGKSQPGILYTRARDASQDNVVDVDRSWQNLQAIATRHGISVKLLDIDNIGHANPGERPTEYNQAFLDYIAPRIDADIAFMRTSSQRAILANKAPQSPPLESSSEH